jgi:hypothetical protein
VQPLVTAVVGHQLCECGFGMHPCSGPAGAPGSLLTSAGRTGGGEERLGASRSPAK